MGLAPSVVLEFFDVFDRLREHVSIIIVDHKLEWRWPIGFLRPSVARSSTIDRRQCC